MQNLAVLRDCILKLEITDHMRVIGLVKDYLHDNRELKNQIIQVIELHDLNSFPRNDHQKRKFLEQHGSNWKKITEDKKQQYELLSICCYILGYTKKLEFKSDNKFKNKGQAHLKIDKETLLNYSKRIFLKLMKSLDKKEVFIPLILIYIISIILLLTVFKKESVFSKNNRIENVNEAPVVDYAKKSITGKYIGEIGKNENAEKFALFVESFKPDKFKCTLIDYPFYNNPKIEFTILKIQDTLYTSQFGELVFRNDSLKILTETTDNKVVFNFTKREN